MDYNNIITSLSSLSRKVGDYIMQVYKTDLDVYYKSDNSPFTIADKKGEEFQLEYKTPKIWPTFYAVIDFQLPGNESTIGPLKVGESFELELEPGVKYEVVNLEGTLENGLKLRKTGPDGASTSDITVSAGKKNG